MNKANDLDPELMDEPVECSGCGEWFDSATNFTLRPLRLVCPHCGDYVTQYDEDAREGK